jgi:hypothetical protein
MKNSINTLAIAATLAKDIELFRNCDTIASIYRNVVPESYIFIEDAIVSNYRISIYNMNLIGKASYLMDIKHLGKFQIM